MFGENLIEFVDSLNGLVDDVHVALDEGEVFEGLFVVRFETCELFLTVLVDHLDGLFAGLESLDAVRASINIKNNFRL